MYPIQKYEKLKNLVLDFQAFNHYYRYYLKIEETIELELFLQSLRWLYIFFQPSVNQFSITFPLLFKNRHYHFPEEKENIVMQ